MSWNLVSTPQITKELLLKTLRREICGFRINDYCSFELAGTLAQAILTDFKRTNYAVRWCGRNVRPASVEEFLDLPFMESDVERGGPTSSTESVKGIDDNPLSVIRQMRQLMSPHLTPIDRLRLELDEAAPLGARLYIMPDGRKAMVGLPRIMESSRELLHADTGRKGCLTANIYLKLPLKGGATRIWNYQGGYEESIGSYLFSEGEIPKDTESVLLEPEVGELVIWNPLSPHAVLPFEKGPRVSLQSWLKILFDGEGDGRFHVEILN
jgi:hypothetical protein